MNELSVCNAPDGAWMDPVFQETVAPVQGPDDESARGRRTSRTRWWIGGALVAAVAVLAALSLRPVAPRADAAAKAPVAKAAEVKARIKARLAARSAERAVKPVKVAASEPAPVTPRANPPRSAGAMPQP